MQKVDLLKAWAEMVCFRGFFSGFFHDDDCDTWKGLAVFFLPFSSSDCEDFSPQVGLASFGIFVFSLRWREESLLEFPK